MELSIEKWVRDQNFDDDSIQLFEESIVCYKAGAYRAGFLFSYLGTQSVLKDRILRGDKPDNVREHFWNETLQKLRDDDIWENVVWTALESKKNGSIFGLEDGHLKTQLEYWKGIRNDCAHAKDNEVISAHVESYWAFLRSNFSRLVVSGGKDSIINRIRRHFDPKYTPINADPSPIIRDMASGVKDEDLFEVFEALEKIIDSEDFIYFLGEISDESALFWKDILELDDNNSKKCVEYLKSSTSEILYRILSEYPNIIAYFSDDPAFIRNLWYEKINKFYKPLEVLASLLDNECIPPEQTTEAIKTVILKSEDTQIDLLTLRRLDSFGFSKSFKEYVFTDTIKLITNFNWANSRTKLVSSFLMNSELDAEIISSLSGTFNSSAYPFDLETSLTKLFRENNELRNKVIEIAEEVSIELPERLGFEKWEKYSGKPH